jgi:PmbA protein
MSIIETILEKAKKRCDCAEAYHFTSETTGCVWAADKLKLAETRETSGIALRVLKDGKIGFFASSKIDDPDKIVDTACELAPYGSSFAGEFPKTFKPVDVDFFHEPTAKAGADRLIEAGNRMVSKAKAAHSEAIYEGKLDRSVVHCTVANSHGARADFRKTIFGGMLWGSVTREGDVLNVFEFGRYNHFDDQPDKFADETIRKLKDAANIVKLPAGEYPCILTPDGMEIFGVLETALNARAVLKDLSPFKDKVGEKILDERVSLVDDGLHDDMPGSQPVDDEGVTSQRTVLVHSGVLKGFIHDLHTSAKMGVAPTGNGMRAGLGAGPRAAFTTLAIEPGSKTLKEMISGIKKGVIVDSVMGAHQASAFSGDYSVNIGLGFVIEDGRIIGRVKDAMLAGNVFRMLREQITEIGSEPKYVGILFPPILFDRMTISTTG